MADNVQLSAGAGGDLMAADELDTLNGVAQGAPKPKAQRFKLLHGGDAQGTDTSSANPLPVYDAQNAAALFLGRAQAFRTPGRAGTTGQKILALHNASASPRRVVIGQVTVDLVQTVIKAATVIPPVIRVHRFTALPTGGTVLAKTGRDSALASHAAITAWGDASADGTLSAAPLAVTIPAGQVLTQEFAGRLITAAGYEMFDRTELLEGAGVVLRPLEGIVLELAYGVVTANPATDFWIAGVDWAEF